MSNKEDLVCWRCGGGLDELSLPLRRLEECLVCAAELHVCKLCEFYDTSVAKSCREPIAEEVRDKEQANFCDYFRPVANAYSAQPKSRAAAEAELKTLFGEENAATKEDPEAALERLFKQGKE